MLFFGAGVSREFPSLAPIARPSGIPGLIDLLRDTILEPLPPDLKLTAAKELPDLGLEQLLESVAGVVGDDALDFLDVLEPPSSRPNYRHLAIARLAAAGRLRGLITVNFDTFLERSLEALGMAYTVPEEADDEAVAYRGVFSDGRLALLKLHGTLRNRASLITTIETVGLGLPRYKTAALRATLEGSDIFFFGYSDNDVDVFREIERADLRGGKVFWHFLDPPDPDAPNLARVASFLAAHPHWMLSGSLNTIFEALLEDVDPAASSEILGVLGFATFDELERAEAKELGRWNDDLRRRVAAHTASWRTPEAAALIVRRSLGEPSKALRRDLLDLVERSPALSSRAELARSNQVAEEMAHRGDVGASIRFRRSLLRKYRRETKGPLRAQLLEEKVRLVSYEVRRIRTFGRGAFRWLAAWFALSPRKARIPERDRSRLRLMLTIRYPAMLHKWGQALFARELAAGMRRLPGKGAAVLLRRVRIAVMRESERRYGSIASNEFGAGFRGLAMLRVAELALLTRGWSPEIDDLIGLARWRTRPGWQGTEEEDEFLYVSIQEGLRLFSLGNLSKARTVLRKTYRYFAARRDVSGKAQSLLYLAAVEVALGRPGRAKRLLWAVRLLKKSYR
ncbi:MAG TPA: SIR2 family protein [Thermoanaerobaculia bacterium]